MKVLISTSTFGALDKTPLSLLKKARIQYRLNPFKRALNESEILSLLKNENYSGLLAGTEPLTEKVLGSSDSLKVISRVGVGMDNIDFKAAKKSGIKVYNTPSVLTDSVAELTLGLILCSLRKINIADRNLKAKIWKKEAGFLLKDKVVGIIGFGNIGQRLAELMKAFGVSIVFYDLRKIKCRFARQATLKRLLTISDIISLNVSGKENVIAQKEIAVMKKGVIIINTSRGVAINEEALYRGLVSGRIGFAGLDVFTKEPYSGKLLTLDNVILTPHIGSYAQEARVKMEREAVENLIKGLRR